MTAQVATLLHSRPSVSAREIRLIVLAESKRVHVGHIGSALSVADILACIYGDLLKGMPDDPERDRFVLSKGHAALALYAALVGSGRLPREQLATFGQNGTLLGVHPECQLPGVDFATGSLGMGLTFAVGAALAAKLQSSSRSTYVLLSDAECNEGSVWETSAFAAHHKLENLTVFVDMNGQQALGYTSDVLAMSNLVERFSAFGWEAIEVDGHDRRAMRDAVLAPRSGKPRVLVCRTTFAKGVSFMERQIKWHYIPMTDDEYAQAVKEVEAGAR